MTQERQSDLFLKSEGDAFYQRNRDKPRLPDPVLDAMQVCNLQPKAVVEIGCGNGWRLAEIDKIFKPEHCVGYEPSEQAVAEKVFKNVFRGTALDLKLIKASFYDLIIFGFCLYLIDREDLFRIVTETDRVLRDGDHIIIHDFVPDYPHRRAYHHKKGVWSYKMDHSKLWLAHPAYKLVHEQSTGEGDDRVGVVVLQKDFANAFPERVMI